MSHPLSPGQGKISDLVHSCFDRDGRKENRPLPIIVLLGTPGSGKTHALSRFAQATRSAPAARLDFKELGQQRPYEVALQLAFQLAQKHPDQSRLRFPRLLIGQTALRAGISAADPRRAEGQLRDALREARRRQVDAAQVAAVVDAGTNAFGMPSVPATEQVVTLLLKAFEWTTVSGLLNRNLAWYAGRSALSETSAVDVLVDLHRRNGIDTSENRIFVDHLLCQAFLADLRGAYAHQSAAQNPLALLDNIDHPGGAGIAFLDLLAELRAEHAASPPQPVDHDPLLVVGSSGTAQAVRGPWHGGPDDPYIRADTDARYEDWLPRVLTQSLSWWYPVRLPALTEAEVARFAALHEEQAAARADRSAANRLRAMAPLVHRLTYGHPWSVQQLHHVVDALLADGRTDTQLHGVLGAELPASTVPPAAARGSRGTAAARGGTRTDARQLSGVARGYLLNGLNGDQRQAAVWLSAARSPYAALNAGLLEGRAEHTRDTILVELRNRLWLFNAVPEDANTRGGVGSPGYLGPPPEEYRQVLHPWLRLLLLDELAGAGPPDTARRPVGSTTRWEHAHTLLRSWYERRGRGIDVLYHRLALNELETVVGSFRSSFRSMNTLGDARSWLRDLYYVTAAPVNRTRFTGASPTHTADDLAREYAPASYDDHELGRPLAELVAALWLAGDPRNRLPPGRPGLNYRIEAMFRQLAMATDVDANTLLDEAARYPV